jgi:hypothetical protein
MMEVMTVTVAEAVAAAIISEVVAITAAAAVLLGRFAKRRGSMPLYCMWICVIRAML